MSEQNIQPDPADVLINEQRATVAAALAGLEDGAVVLKYEPSQNPTDAMLPGVPLRDLTAGDIRAMPEWLQRSVFNAPGFMHVAV
jgi:hypothetical protein